MKTTKIMNVVLAGTMVLAAACAGEEADEATTSGYSVVAGDQARELGIDSYRVRHDGTVSRIELLDIEGQNLGVLAVNETAEFQSASFTGAESANTVDMHASRGGYSIGVNGETRVHLSADKSGNVQTDLQSDLSDVEGDLALLAAAMNDGVQINPNGPAAYELRDCPWYFTLITCAGCATVGEFIAPCIACGACLGSYLV
jgi:hypothetical protein